MKNPMPVPDDVRDIDVAREWMLARMDDGKAVVDPIFRNVVLPDGSVWDGREDSNGNCIMGDGERLGGGPGGEWLEDEEPAPPAPGP